MSAFGGLIMHGKKFLHSIRLKNLLSFGSEGVSLELEPLNVLIGPNASGKSNLIEAISLIAATPRDLTAPFRNGGGLFSDWIWKGASGGAKAELEVSLEYVGQGSRVPLDYKLALQAVNYRPRVRFEALLSHDQPGAGYFLRESHDPENLLKPDQSILAQLRDPLRYPELTFVGDQFSLIAFFREWHIGRGSRVRGPQPADLPNDFLLENAANLGLVLNNLQNRPATKKLILEKLSGFYEGVEDYQVKVEGGTVQIFLHEKGLNTAVPATRASDGTLHYLALLAILCHPEPPPLVCIEEPELGLHPDILPTVAELLIQAAERTQLIVTTHSEALVSSLSRIPEAVVICERTDAGTSLRRLEPEKLQEWLERYRLGELWSMGEIGGNRW
jgi:predicted ATPase